MALRALANGLRARPLPGDALKEVRAGAETARQVLHEEEARAERLSAVSRLVAAGGGLLLAAAWALTGQAPPGVALSVVALAFVVVYAIPMLLAQWRRFNPWIGYLGLAFDMATLTTYLAALAVLYPWPGGAASALHFPAWLFLIVVIAGNALSLRIGRVVAAGLLAAVATLALALFALINGALLSDVVADFSGPDLSLVGIVTRVVMLLLIAGLLALVVARAREIIGRAAQAEAAAATFGRYFSPAVARRLLEGLGGTLQGQRVEATLIQSDVRGFTSLSEQIPPEQVLAMLNIYFEAMLEILFRHDGTIIGFQGDGMLAAFGVPEARPDDADRALRCVQEMLQKVDELGAPSGKLPGLRIGIALHSGVVVAGNLGSRRRMEYTVLGDAVNATARIEALNKELGTRLLVSEATRARLSRPESLRPVGRFELRGRAQPVELYTPEALVPAPVSGA